MSLSTPPPITPAAPKQPADIAQLMLISSLAMLFGLALPARGTFSLLGFVMDNIMSQTITGLMVLMLIFGGLGVFASVAAIFQRHRLWGIITLLSGSYVMWVGDRYGRIYAWNQPVRLGGYLLFAGSLFLIGTSLIYLARPGVRPERISFFGSTIRWQQLRTIAFLCCIGAVLAVQQQFTTLGTLLIIIGLVFGITAVLLRWEL